MEYQTITLNKGKWTRSQNGIVAGVCRGIAESWNIDTWLIRLLWLATILFFGTGILAYIIMALCLPREDQIHEANKKRLLGVCSRAAQKLDLEVGLVRIAAVVLALMSFGVTIVGYIILHFVLEQNESNDRTLLR